MKKGEINLKETDLCISPKLKENTFLNTKVGKTADLLIDNEGYHTYGFGPYKIDEDYFYFLLIFYNKNIWSVQMTMYDDQSKSANNPKENGFNEKNLINEKAKHDAWLFSHFGYKGPYNFPWGAIESTYDKKAWSAFIIFDYKPIGNSLVRIKGDDLKK